MAYETGIFCWIVNWLELWTAADGVDIDVFTNLKLILDPKIN